MEITERVTRSFHGGISVELQISDTTEHFKWRLVSGEHETQWTGHYEGILTLVVGKRVFGVVTQYFDGDIKAEVPFEIVQP
jgi:hypothetical protein